MVYFFCFLSLGQAFITGSLFALILSDITRFSLIYDAVLFSIIAIAGSALVALTPTLWLAFSNFTLLLFPSFVASIVFSPHHISYSFLVALYFLYMLSIAVRNNKEYYRAFNIEKQLAKKGAALEQMNKMDPLTHIYNRGHFNTTYQYQWHNGIRHQCIQSLLMIDVDHFKDVNDRFGHLFGDECLISIAKRIHDTAKRKTDLIARFGGEEFVVLLSDTSLVQALEIAEVIRKKVSECPCSYQGEQFDVTVSIGVASLLPQSDMNSNQLIENADKTLYEAKCRGRNIVCSYDVLSS